MTHEVSLSRKFSKLKTMTTKEAKAWWAKYPGDVIIKPGSIHRRVLIPWPYKFPEGHELTGLVNELKADQIVHETYDKKYLNNQRKYEIVGNEVFQLCPCGLKHCTVHVIPSTVKIKASFKLEMHSHTRKRGKSGKKKENTPIFLEKLSKNGCSDTRGREGLVFRCGAQLHRSGHSKRNISQDDMQVRIGI